MDIKGSGWDDWLADWVVLNKVKANCFLGWTWVGHQLDLIETLL